MTTFDPDDRTRIAKIVAHHHDTTHNHGDGAAPDGPLTRHVRRELADLKADGTRYVYCQEVADRLPSYSRQQVAAAMRTLNREGAVEKWGGAQSKWVIKV